MDVKIGVGLDNIVFGMSQDEVKNLLGAPDKVSNTEWTYRIVLTFNSLMTKFKFDEKENLKLVSIETYYPDAIMFNQRIIGKEKQKWKHFFKVLALVKLNTKFTISLRLYVVMRLIQHLSLSLIDLEVSSLAPYLIVMNKLSGPRR